MLGNIFIIVDGWMIDIGFFFVFSIYNLLIRLRSSSIDYDNFVNFVFYIYV